MPILRAEVLRSEQIFEGILIKVMFSCSACTMHPVDPQDIFCRWCGREFVKVNKPIHDVEVVF